MGKKVIFYAVLVTGIVVILVGIQSAYTFWGDTTIPGITGQVTGFVCIIGGLINLWVARNVNKQKNAQD